MAVMNLEDLRKVLKEEISELDAKIDKKLKNHQAKLEAILDSKFEKRIKPMEKKIDVLESKVTDIERNLTESNDILSRICNLQLNSVPFRDGENLRAIYGALALKLGYEIPLEVTVRRFKGLDDEKRPILISFATELQKRQFLQRFKSKLSEMKRSILPGFPDDSSKIYLQHDFTTNQYLLYKTAMNFYKENSVFKIVVQTGNRIVIQIAESDKLCFFPDASSLKTEIERRAKSSNVQAE